MFAMLFGWLCSSCNPQHSKTMLASSTAVHAKMCWAEISHMDTMLLTCTCTDLPPKLLSHLQDCPDAQICA
jgi:hypothetical protein